MVENHSLFKCRAVAIILEIVYRGGLLMIRPKGGIYWTTILDIGDLSTFWIFHPLMCRV